MRIDPRKLLALSCMALWIGCSAGPAGTAAISQVSAVDRKTEEADVRRALDDFFTAAERKDWRHIDGLLSRDFSFFSDDLMKLGRAEFLKAMEDDAMEIAKLELQDVSVELSDDAAMAFVKYGVALESSIHGEPYNMLSVETVVYRKEEGRWKMLHNHASIRKL
jgi:ketosteroid isomerase-like protein